MIITAKNGISVAINVEDKATIEKSKAEEEATQKVEEEAKQKTETEKQQNTTSQQQSSVSEVTPNENMVWTSKSGNKYHSNPNCSNMKKPPQ